VRAMNQVGTATQSDGRQIATPVVSGRLTLDASESNAVNTALGWLPHRTVT
jgi:hypothetical protein